MAHIVIIAAIGQNRELGKNNNLIWHLKEDLKFFKETTMNHKIVMGYNTFKSLPKLLPKRKHLILTHQNIPNEEVEVFSDFKELLNYLNNLNEDIYIIGGASIYKQFLPYASELLLTEIEAECKDADAYFPDFDKSKYTKEEISNITSEEIKYQHIRYRRVK